MFNQALCEHHQGNHQTLIQNIYFIKIITASTREIILNLIKEIILNLMYVCYC